MTSKIKKYIQIKDLALGAQSKHDLQIISALDQDSVLIKKNIRWIKNRHRFSLLIHRFKWELMFEEKNRKGASKRVQAILMFDTITDVLSRGLNNALQDEVLSLMQIDLKNFKHFEEIKLIFSGKTEIKLRAEVVNVRLRDLKGSDLFSLGNVPKHKI